MQFSLKFYYYYVHSQCSYYFIWRKGMRCDHIFHWTSHWKLAVEYITFELGRLRELFWAGQTDYTLLLMSGSWWHLSGDISLMTDKVQGPCIRIPLSMHPLVFGWQAASQCQATISSTYSSMLSVHFCCSQNLWNDANILSACFDSTTGICSLKLWC